MTFSRVKTSNVNISSQSAEISFLAVCLPVCLILNTRALLDRRGGSPWEPSIPSESRRMLNIYFFSVHTVLSHTFFFWVFIGASHLTQDAYSMHKDNPHIFINLAVWFRSKWRIDDSLELPNQLAHIVIQLERAPVTGRC